MAEADEIKDEPISEENSGQSSWWGSSWLQAAKTKSVEVFDTVRKDVNDLAQSAKHKSVEVMDYVRKDFDEFSQTIQEEVSSTASSVSTVLKEKLKIDETGVTAASVKKSVTSFFNQVSDAFYIPPEDDDEPIFLDRLTAIIYTMGCDPSTFLVDPDEEGFEAWQASLNLESQKDDIDALLTNNEKLRKLFDEMVPSKVPESIFWARYLYRIHVAREKETKRQLIRKEAQVIKQDTAQDNEISWGEDDMLKTVDEIPEEVQSQLLADYEKECEGRVPTVKKGTLKCKEKDDMVLVTMSGDSGSTSPSKESSNEEEWEEAVAIDSSTSKKISK